MDYMNLRYTNCNIKILMLHTLQDYLSIYIQGKHLEASWRTHLYDLTKCNVDGKYHSSYKGTWDKLQQNGAGNINVTDLDITIINAIFTDKNNFFDDGSRILTRIKDLNISRRSGDSHETGNESPHELVQWGYATLTNIERLLKTILEVYNYRIKNEGLQLSIERINKFFRQHNDTLKKLRSQIAIDYENAMGAEYLTNSYIRLVEKSSFPIETFQHIHQLHSLNAKMKEFLSIATTLALNGFSPAYKYAAAFYFGEYHALSQPDYIKAAHYYELGIGELNRREKLNLASIYLNNIAGTPNQGQKLFEECQNTLAKTRNGSPIYKIESYKTPDNYTFWREEKIPPI